MRWEEDSEISAARTKHVHCNYCDYAVEMEWFAQPRIFSQLLRDRQSLHSAAF